MPRRCTAREHLDDNHTTATAWTRWLGGIDGGSGGLALRCCNGEQLTGACDVVGASGFGEEAVVADAMQAFWQHVDEKAADELVGGDGHALVPIAALAAVVLALEGDALLVAGDQAAVGDGDAVGVARQMSFSRNSRRNRRESTRTGRKKPGRQDTQRWPSGEMPPPGTIMCTWG
jgi:hypothetical protein